jgi:hypothetical protein
VQKIQSMHAKFFLTHSNSASQKPLATMIRTVHGIVVHSDRRFATTSESWR